MLCLWSRSAVLDSLPKLSQIQFLCSVKLSANQTLHCGRWLKIAINTLDKECYYVLFILPLTCQTLPQDQWCCRKCQKTCRKLWSLTPAAGVTFWWCWLMFPHIGAMKSRFCWNKTFEMRHHGIVCALICAINMWLLYSAAHGYWKASELLKKSNLIEVKYENTRKIKI